MKTHISGLSISDWSGQNPEGSFTLYHDGGSSTHKLSKEAVRKILNIAYDVVEAEKVAIAEKVMKIERPPLLAGQEGKPLIEHQDPAPSGTPDNEIPF